MNKSYANGTFQRQYITSEMSLGYLAIITDLFHCYLMSGKLLKN